MTVSNISMAKIKAELHSHVPSLIQPGDSYCSLEERGGVLITAPSLALPTCSSLMGNVRQYRVQLSMSHHMTCCN